MTHVTTEQAAKQLYTTAYTVRKYIRQGKLKASLVGKKYLVPIQQVETLLNTYREVSQNPSEGVTQ